MLWWVRSRSREGVARAGACADVSNANANGSQPVAVHHCQAVDRRMRGTLRDLLTCTFSSEPLHQHQRSSGKPAVQQSLTTVIISWSTTITRDVTLLIYSRLHSKALRPTTSTYVHPFFFLLDRDLKKIIVLNCTVFKICSKSTFHHGINHWIRTRVPQYIPRISRL